MTLHLFTQIHVAISLIGIAFGLVAIAGFLRSYFGRFVNLVFLVFTVATSVTGFFFPFHGVTPAIILGVLSLIVLCIAIMVWRQGRRKAYVICAIIAEYFNVFVLIVQLFQKVPSLHALAPTGSGPIFGIVQLLALATFITAGVLAVKRYRVVGQR